MGSVCIFPIEIVVIISIVVRFTLKAASKKNGLKKVVAKVMIMRRMEGRNVVKSSFITFLFNFICIETRLHDFTSKRLRSEVSFKVILPG